jgi:cyclophilin family peptidyl-prolyl cis-trans isomerase
LHFWSRRSKADSKPSPAAVVADELIDCLEQRLALYSSPFLASPPPLSELANNQNTVLRMQTTQGIIDIELYDVGGPNGGSAAPITTSNFLNYVRSGRLDGTFFHRLVSDFVLQGGGFSLKDPVPTSPPLTDSVQTDPAIQNEFNADRSNIARTLAMAKLGNSPNSATSQFFINLADNSGNLNGQNGGFTVFGKVVGGWSVVTTITGFSTHDLNSAFGGNAFDEVPLSGTNNTDVISIVDVDVIKRKNQTAYFTETAYFPDGFRNGRSSASVELVNTDVNAGSQYQIIARFESGRRDTVIAEGFLFAGSRISIPVYKGGDPSINKVRAGTGFSYEIRSTKALGVSINMQDFGATAGEAAIQPATLTAANVSTWSFVNGQKGTGLGSYLIWQNMSNQSATVTTTFYPEVGSPYTLTRTLKPYTRGGYDVGQLVSVPSGLYSVRVTSTQPIAAVLSQYRASPARASTQTGVVAGESTQGVLPGASIPSAGQSLVTVLYNGTSPATVTIDFDFILSNGTVLTNTAPFTLSTSVRRRVLDLAVANINLPRNQTFTVRYRVHNDAAPVSAAYSSVVNGDNVATAFQTYSSQTAYFADGFTDPTSTNNSETISLYNPFTSNTTMTYRLKFHFVNNAGAEVILPSAGEGDDRGRQAQRDQRPQPVRGAGQDPVEHQLPALLHHRRDLVHARDHRGRWRGLRPAQSLRFRHRQHHHDGPDLEHGLSRVLHHQYSVLALKRPISGRRAGRVTSV